MARRKRKPKSTAAERSPRGDSKSVAGVRIIGGRFRGRRIHYTGDARTRPMKDRLREAIFNLVGPSIRGKHALDLFAGTGALALEALSRGAGRATLIEQHHPTANVIRRNVAELGVETQAEVVAANVFIWGKMESGLFSLSRSSKPTGCNPWAYEPPRGESVLAQVPITPVPWVVFCSPPYDFYVSRTAEMLELIEGLIGSAPAESVFVVEADARFDFRLLPDPGAWNVRSYPPAVAGIFRKKQLFSPG
ncbi:MAG: RsmD family RNA methyltransferase [Planctomycetes bacterium]|nr:RsmD family RNA methyltransferase [Planctomycetota bacterium]